MDWTDWSDPSYVAPKPGSVDDNILYQNVAKAADSVFGSQPVEANSLLATPCSPTPNRRPHPRAELPPPSTSASPRRMYRSPP
ncbi:MAG TPA: hypothetical protein VI320_20550 [Terracidiphilus sp.]|jgi:hypothetical protein